MNTVWTNEKIQEWRKSFGYVSSHLAKKIFDNSTHDYPRVRHEWEVMPKFFAVVRFSSLSDPMHEIHRNKETFPVNLLENTHAGKKR